MPKIDELTKKIDKFEDKVKLSNLMVEKRFAELDLKLGKLEEKFKEVLTGFPEFKERAGDIEDLLSVINLGLIKFKENFEKLSSRISGLEKVPENIEKTMMNYEKKLESLGEDIQKLSAGLSTLDTLKEDITKTTDEKISSNVKTLREESERNRTEIGHIKKSLDAFSSAMKSFERTIELTNLDDIIRRFDSLDRKILNAQAEIDKLRTLTPDMSVVGGDIDVLKTRLKEISSTVMSALSRMNEFEMNINKKLALLENFTVKAENLEYIESVSKNIGKEIANMNEIKATVHRLHDDAIKRISGLRNIDDELKKLKVGITNAQKMVDLNRSRLESFDKEGMIKAVMDNKRKIEGSMKLTENVQKRLEGFESRWSVVSERTSKLEDDLKSVMSGGEGVKLFKKDIENIWNSITSLNSTLSDIKNKINSLEKRGVEIVPEKSRDIETIKAQVEGIKKSMLSFKRIWADYQKMIDDKLRILKVERVREVPREVPKNIMDEISSLRGIVSRLSTENEDLRKMVRDMRITQMGMLAPDVFTNMASKISSIEKKLIEIDEEMSKISKTKPLILE